MPKPKDPQPVSLKAQVEDAKKAAEVFLKKAGAIVWDD